MENNGNSSNNNAKFPPLPPYAPAGGSSHDAHDNQTSGAIGGRRGRPPPPSASDQLVPIANVIRIMRKALPPHAKISDEAKVAIQESVSEFISFVTEEANQRCHSEQRKTITGEDLLCSMERLGFDNYVEPLAYYLQKYRESEGIINPRRQTFRPSPTTKPIMLGGLMPGPTAMVPPMQMNPSSNITGMFITGGHQNRFGYGPGGSSSTSFADVYVPSLPVIGEGSCPCVFKQINYQDEVEFDSTKLPAAVADAGASPSRSTSANYVPAANDPFA